MVDEKTTGNPYTAPVEQSEEEVDGPMPGAPSSDGNAILRAVAFSSFGILLLHLAAIPLLFGIGAVFWLGSNEWMTQLLGIMMFTALVSVAVLCVSTQFYLASKRK